MNCIKITFTPKTNIDDHEAITDLLWDYLGCLYKNGQILKDYLLTQNDDSYMAFITPSDDDALDENHNSVYVSEYLTELKNFLDFHTEIIGENLNTEKICCCAEKPKWYMLYTDWTVEGSPVVCGQCGKSVSLYKLPHILGQQEHYGVLGWYQAYKNVDSLFLYCLSDRFTYRQMNNPESQLSKYGRDICKAFEEATGIPFYYYLFHYQGLHGRRKTPAICPSCGKDWKLTGKKTFIDYKCDKCRLVADEV